MDSKNKNRFSCTANRLPLIKILLYRSSSASPHIYDRHVYAASVVVCEILHWMDHPRIGLPGAVRVE